MVGAFDIMNSSPPNTGVQRIRLRSFRELRRDKLSLPPSLFELRRTSRSTALGAGLSAVAPVAKEEALAKAADAGSFGSRSR